MKNLRLFGHIFQVNQKLFKCFDWIWKWLLFFVFLRYILLWWRSNHLKSSKQVIILVVLLNLKESGLSFTKFISPLLDIKTSNMNNMNFLFFASFIHPSDIKPLMAFDMSFTHCQKKFSYITVHQYVRSRVIKYCVQIYSALYYVVGKKLVNCRGLNFRFIMIDFHL